jgi:hypothetical protein
MRDILVRIRTSAKWIRIPNQLTIQLLSSVTLKMQKSIFFIFFFFYLAHRHIIFSLAKFCVKILILQALFQSFLRKGKDPDPYP